MCQIFVFLKKYNYIVYFGIYLYTDFLMQATLLIKLTHHISYHCRKILFFKIHSSFLKKVKKPKQNS